MQTSWLEISEGALAHNLKTFRGLIGDSTVLAPTVKANAYGHGLADCGRIFEKNGADYLCVNALFEARELRRAGVKIPILIIGYTPLSDLADLPESTELTVYNADTIKRLGEFDQRTSIHLKIETGNHRQGIGAEELPEFIRLIKQNPNVELAGVSTHFADLEDTDDRRYAHYQLDRFNEAIRLIEEAGLQPHYRHSANTAATLLLPEARFNFVRVGIGAYGLWPSEIIKQAVERAGATFSLKPAMTWKTIVAQVKPVKKGALIGYGGTHQMERDGIIAVLPVGYYDGYPRSLGNRAHVLIHGQKAPVVGRVCMNMIMADITGIPNVRPEDEAVLLGAQQNETVIAEQIADWAGTISYEVVARVNERIVRLITSRPQDC